MIIIIIIIDLFSVYCSGMSQLKGVHVYLDAAAGKAEIIPSAQRRSLRDTLPGKDSWYLETENNRFNVHTAPVMTRMLLMSTMQEKTRKMKKEKTCRRT